MIRLWGERICRGDFEAEGLFAMSAARGFTRHGSPPDQMTPRRA
jgi:hypothetical protein